MTMKQSLIGRIRHFLGLFNSTEFESRLIEHLLKTVDPGVRAILSDQISRFNQVQRLLVDDPRLKCGTTMFYWIKFGKSMIQEFPARLPGLADVEERTFFRCLVKDSGKNVIEVEFVAVHGVFVLLRFCSSNRVWYPQGAYTIETLTN
jgi:hypothetical protein